MMFRQTHSLLLFSLNSRKLFSATFSPCFAHSHRISSISLLFPLEGRVAWVVRLPILAAIIEETPVKNAAILTP